MINTLPSGRVPNGKPLSIPSPLSPFFHPPYLLTLRSRGYPLLRILSLHYSHSCLATHIHTPIPSSLLPPPRFWTQPTVYLRFLLARLSRASLFRFGYIPSDFPLTPPSTS